MATTKIDKTADQAIKKLQGLLMGMCGRTGYTPDAVFEGLLDYIIGYLNPSLTPEPVEGWKFKQDDLPTFHEMLREVIECYKNEIPRRRWYDPFGDLYMALHPGGGGKAQFFTPPSVSQVTAEVCMSGMDISEAKGCRTPFGQRICINDPAAGSSRLLLAGAAIFRRLQRDVLGYDEVQQTARRPYLIAEDLDYNCVKMSAINMAVHGCFGECVCHDSLCEPEAVRLGYIVNEMMWPFPTNIPSIRRYTDPRRFVCTAHWLQREALLKAEKEQSQESVGADSNNVAPAPTLSDPVQVEKPKQPQQLSLW